MLVVKHGVFAVSIAMASAAAASGQEAPAIARYVPPTPDARHVFVLDSAHILSDATIAALQDSARALQTATGADVAWITLPTLGRRAIEEAGVYVGRTWKIGSPGAPGDPLRNRGLVILFVPDKKKTAGSNIRVEVGNGLEGTITDSRSRAIITAMKADLKAKRYDAAYIAGWNAAAALVREDAAAQHAGAGHAGARHAATAAAQHASVVSIVLSILLLCALVVLALLFAMAVRRGWRSPPPGYVPPPSGDDEDPSRRSRGGWAGFLSDVDGGSSGSSGSDGGSFGGGGGFSGGGSSDSI